MTRKLVSEDDIVSFFNFAIASAADLPETCRECRVVQVERRLPQQGRSNWTYRLTDNSPDECQPSFDKIARELGAVFDLK